MNRAIVQSLRGGDVVEFLVPAGIGRNGPEWRPARGTVDPLLIFERHVCVKPAGRSAVPRVVDERNFLRVVRRARA